MRLTQALDIILSMAKDKVKDERTKEAYVITERHAYFLKSAPVFTQTTNPRRKANG